MRFTQILVFTSSLLLIPLLLISCTKDTSYKKWKGWASLSEEQQSFFAEFYSDSVFQKEHVQIPLKSQWVEEDNNTLEEITMTEYITHEEYSYINLNDESYYGDFTKVSAIEFQLLLRQIDTGVYIIFEFAKIEGAWQMTKIMDLST